jgi:hypothetical protein
LAAAARMNVHRMPNAGISANPAASVPAMAPAVFVRYNNPTLGAIGPPRPSADRTTSLSRLRGDVKRHVADD